MAKMTGDFDIDILPKIGAAGWVMTGLASIISSSFGWSIGQTLTEKIPFAIGLGMASFLLAFMVTASAKAARSKNYVVSGVAAVAALLTGIVEYGSSLGYTAAHRAANVQQASVENTRYEDGRGNVDVWQATLKRLTDERSLMTPKRSAAEARAVIDRTEAHKLFRGATEGCKITKGPQSRALCDDYLNAKADLALWDQISVQEGKLADAQAKLEQARTTAGAINHGVSTAAKQSEALAVLANLSLTPSDDAKAWTDYGVAMMLSLWFLVIGSACFVVAYGLAPQAANAAKSLAGGFSVGSQAMTIRDLAAAQGMKLAA